MFVLYSISSYFVFKPGMHWHTSDFLKLFLVCVCMYVCVCVCVCVCLYVSTPKAINN